MMLKYLQWQLRTDSVSNSVEDDIDSTRHDAAVPRHPLDCIRLASAGCSIGEEQLVLPLQEVPHHWSHHLPKHRSLATTWTENLGEGVPASAMVYLKGYFLQPPLPFLEIYVRLVAFWKPRQTYDNYQFWTSCL